MTRSASLRSPRGALAAAFVLALSVVGLATPARAAVSCALIGTDFAITMGDNDTVALTWDIPNSLMKVNGGTPASCAQSTAGITSISVAGSSGNNVVTISGPLYANVTMTLGTGTDEVRYTASGTAPSQGFVVNATTLGDGSRVYTGIDTAERLSITMGSGPNTLDAAASPIGVSVTGGTGIDTVQGSAFADTIALGGGNDVAGGGGGNDALSGGDGDDILGGEAGADTINGEAGNDLLAGGADNDTINGGAGNEAMSGEAGTDTLSFAGGSAVTLDLNITTPQNTGNGSDAVADFENVIGSSANDTLIGSSTTYSFDGGTGTDTVNYSAATTNMTVSLAAGTATGAAPGPDVLTGVENVTTGSGNDTIIGDGNSNVLNAGAGVDTVSYATSIAAVTIDLGVGSASGAGSDTLIGFENAIGGSGNDTFKGNASDNVFDGAAGDDKFTGGGGNDTLKGGLGIDTVIYKGTANGVSVDLTAKQGGGGAAGTDSLDGIENVTGTSSADNIRGDGLGNVLKGGGGADTINGLNGADTLGGGPGDDKLYGGNGDDTINGGPGADVCNGGKGTNAITKC